MTNDPAQSQLVTVVPYNQNDTESTQWNLNHKYLIY